MNVDFSPYYVKYACPVSRQIVGEREPIASLPYSDRWKLKIPNSTGVPVEAAK